MTATSDESMRRRLERAEDASLAPWALRSAAATRRHPVEDRGRAFDYRTQYQRDRDRILYSRAFRRLRHKSLSGRLPETEDHRRNRLTHTLEVAQLARTIGRALELNEDLIEAAALGHDLGQPPFAAVGERALDDLLSGRLDGRGGPGLGDLGGFSGATQGLRVVDELEKRYDAHAGLNLTDDVREGIWKSGTRLPRAHDVPDGLRPGLAPSFETQTVRLADRIATVLAELDDALMVGVLELAQVERLSAVRELRRKLGAGYRQRASRFVRGNTIHRGLTHLLVTDAIVASRRSLATWGKRVAADGPEVFARCRDRAVEGGEIGLSGRGARLLEDLDGFLESRVRRGREADRVESRGRRIVLGLTAAFHADPALLDDHQLLRFKEIANVRYLRDLPREAVPAEVSRHYRANPVFVRLLADHVAGMTESYAAAEQARLAEMGAIPIPSVEQLRREEGSP